MRLSVIDDDRLAVWAGDTELVDITSLVDAQVDPAERMTALIAGWDELGPRARELQATGPRIPAGAATVRAPQPSPRQIVAAPVNYHRHQQEMGGETGVYRDAKIETIETYVGFVKASSSIVGPDRPIELPFADRRTDYEGELGVVIGRTASCVAEADALDHVFGYVPLLDITLRGAEDRSFRKSFDTFTAIGPWIVTADEVPDPDRLDLELRLNGTVRQHATTADLIYGVRRLVATYSEAMTLGPGDLIATGTPEGVGEIVPGDEIDLTLEAVGHLRMRVAARVPAAAGAAH